MKKMPRKYIKKKIAPYTQEDMSKAIQAVIKGEMTMYTAAKTFKIPTTTLFGRIKENSKAPKVGRPLAIPLSCEQRLADAIVTMEKWGFGLTRQEVLAIVAEYVKNNNLKTPFSNNKPGPDWFINFRKRHGLSIKKPQPVEYMRKKMTDPFIISDFFTLLENALTDLNLFKKPELIWNLDETSLCLDPTKTKVVGKINKPCSRTTCGTGKENITILAAVNATGKKITPLIVYKGKQMWDQWMAKTDFEISYAASSKGWMETSIFYNYLDKILIPALGKDRPVLLIFDGHSTHVDANVVELAIKNNITILKLPPHTSHLLQPLDVAVFKSFKSMWDKKLVEWQRHNVGKKMPKNIFAQTFAETWQKISCDVIQNGFKKSGIYPFNRNIIPNDKYEPTALKRYRTQVICRTPKSLRTLCIEVLNSKNSITSSTTDLSELTHSIKEQVTLLSDLTYKKDSQIIPFAASQMTSLPQCLQEDNNSSAVSFEELVLERIKQDKQNIPLKRKRVAKGAEIITQTILKKYKEKEQQVKQEKKQKTPKPKLETVPSSSKPHNKSLKNIKRRPSTFSIGSISITDDILSTNHKNSEFDVVAWVDSDAFQIGNDMNKENVSHYNLSQSQQEIDLNIKKTFCSTREDDKNNLILDEKTGCIRLASNESDKLIARQSNNKKKNVDNITMEPEALTDRKKDTSKQRTTKLNRQKKWEDSSTTSEDNIMSVHSDSDIEEVVSPDDYEEDEGIIKNKVDMKEAAIFENIRRLEQIDKTAHLQKIASEKSTIPERTMNTKEEKCFDKENNNDVNSEVQKNKVTFELGKTIIVKYYIKKKWKYYVGVITETNDNQFDKTYETSFYKSKWRNNILIFMKPKKADTDCIPGDIIVKEVELIQIRENPNEFVLKDMKDNVYFKLNN